MAGLSFNIFGIDPVSALAGIVSGLLAGYLAQWMYRIVLPAGPSEPFGSNQGAYQGGSTGNAGAPTGSPTLASSINPLVGMVVLLIMNAVAAWAMLQVAGPILRDRLSQSMFFFAMNILQLDDWLVLSRRAIAPLGGDPLIGARGAKPTSERTVGELNDQLSQPFPQYPSIPRPEGKLFP